MERVVCKGCNNVCLGELCCPKCLEYGVNSFFCSQLCFEASWQVHALVHSKEPHESRAVVRDVDPHQSKDESVESVASIQTVHVDSPKNVDLVGNMKDLLVLPEKHPNARLTFDVESHETTRETPFQVSKWVNDAAIKLASSLDATEAAKSSRAAKKYLQRQMRKRQGLVGLTGTKVYTSHAFNRSIRNIIVAIACLLLFIACYLGATQFVKLLEIRQAVHVRPLIPHSEAVAIEELRQAMEGMRLELNKLRESVYNNSVAVKALAGHLKSSGANDDVHSKRNKFAKPPQQSINKNTSRQNIAVEQRNPTSEPMKPHDPTLIVHEAPVMEVTGT